MSKSSPGPASNVLHLRRKLTSERPDSRANQQAIGQYIILCVKPGEYSIVRTLLSTYQEICILDEISGSALLVEMPDETRRRISLECPDLVIESNQPYKAANATD